MSKEAMKLALEALEDLGMKHFESTGEVLHKEVFDVLKEALAKQEQGEPVCHICKGTGEMDSGGTYPWGWAINIPCECTAPQPKQEQGEPVAIVGKVIKNLEPLLSAKNQSWSQAEKMLLCILENQSEQPKQEQGEPVAWISRVGGLFHFEPVGELDPIPLYTTPQQRTWVGLDWGDLPEEWVGNLFFKQGARWAEAKLKEKNGL